MRYALMSLFVFTALSFSGCGGGGSGASGGGSDNTFSLSGSLFFKQGMTVDGDTLDPYNIKIDNDGADTSKTQSIDYPATVSGFLGVINGEKDIVDVYKTSMLKDQSVTLVIADPDNHDFDLFLYDEGLDEITNSVGTGNIEQISIPADGDYYIVVSGYSVENSDDQGGLYTLTTGEDNSVTSTYAFRKTHLSTQYAMMEDEVLYGSKPITSRRSTGVSLLPSTRFDSDIRSMRKGAGGVTRLRLKKSTQSIISRSVSRHTSLFNTELPQVIKKVKALRRNDAIAYAQPNYLYQAQTVPNDEYYHLQWHYPQINLPLAWEITTGSPDVIVAVIDTGVVLNHPDLKNKLVSGYDFISSTSNAVDGNGIDSDPNDPGDGSHAGQSSFHGTHVAGTIAAQTNNGIGVAGVAWGVKIMPIRALGAQGGSDYDIAQSIRYAAGLSNDSGTLPAKKADIINMSLGGPGSSSVMKAAILAAKEAGVIVIAAAGNENSNANSVSPAGLPGVVTVSAVDYSAVKAPYSNYGSSVDVAAPGGDSTSDANGDGNPDGVLSTLAKDDGSYIYSFYQGTSMAAPHIAGVAALMKSVYPGLTPNDFDLLLAENHPSTKLPITTDLGSAGKDDIYGYGLINALNAVEAAGVLAGNPQPTEPILALQPETLQFTASLSSAQLSLYNIGGGSMEVTSVTATEPWITVKEQTAGSLVYDVTVDQSGLSNGVYQGTIEIASNGGDKSVSVILSIADTDVAQGEIGTVYVLLIDPDTFETTVGTQTNSLQNYAFTISNIPAGNYYLAAGTDLNADDYISDEGEDFGIYPILSSITEVNIQSDLSGFAFNVEPLIALPSTSAVGEGQQRKALQIRKTP